MRLRRYIIQEDVEDALNFWYIGKDTLMKITLGNQKSIWRMPPKLLNDFMTYIPEQLDEFGTNSLKSGIL
jgi:hypothetical protein